jgi:hypothetical protein
MLPILLLVQVVANSELGYRMTLPDEFVRITEFIPFPGNAIVDCWGGDASGGGSLILCVERMRAVLGRERLKPTELPPRTQLLTVRWQGFDIDVIRADTVKSGAPFVVYRAQVPLRREAIQVIVAAPLAATAQAQATLSTVLGSLQGESNWPTSEQRGGRLGSIVGWIMGIAIGVIVVRIAVTRRRARAAYKK